MLQTPADDTVENLAALCRTQGTVIEACPAASPEPYLAIHNDSKIYCCFKKIPKILLNQINKEVYFKGLFINTKLTEFAPTEFSFNGFIYKLIDDEFVSSVFDSFQMINEDDL